MRTFTCLAFVLCTNLFLLNCEASPEDKSVNAAEPINTDSLAVLDSLRAQVSGWEAQALEGLNDLKANCRVKEEQLLASGQAILEDSSFLNLQAQTQRLSDSIRTGILYRADASGEAQIQTLKLINTLVEESEEPEDLKEALILFCKWAGTRTDTTSIIQ